MTSPARALAALALVAALSTPSARALVLSSVTDNGNLVDTSFTTPTHAAVDVGFFLPAPVSVEFLLDAGDAGGSVSFNSILSELSGIAFAGLRLTLSDGASFGTVGSVSTLGGDAAAARLDAAASSALLAPFPAFGELYVGNPLGDGSTDWRIGFSGLTAGSAFTLTLTPVSAPGTLGLLLTGLGLLGTRLRRSRDIERGR